MAAKSYYNEVFLAAADDAIMRMLQEGTLLPNYQVPPTRLVEMTNITSLAVADTPTPKGTARAKRKEGTDVYTNQKGMRVLAARNVLGQ